MRVSFDHTTQVRLRLAARAWSRMLGGYGIFGQWRGTMRCSVFVAIVWTAQVLISSLFRGDLSMLETSMSTPENAQVFIIYCFVIAVILVVTEIFIKPWARSMPISDELRALAQKGVPEAAYALAELNDAQGAKQEANEWLEHAAALGHRKAMKQLKRNKK